MSDKASISIHGKSYEFPVVEGTENEVAIDIKTLRAATGIITLDPGFKNTGSCESAITFLDGEKGVLRYRGYSIEELAEKADFLEVAYLLIFGELPNPIQQLPAGDLANQLTLVDNRTATKTTLHHLLGHVHNIGLWRDCKYIMRHHIAHRAHTTFLVISGTQDGL